MLRILPNSLLARAAGFFIGILVWSILRNSSTARTDFPEFGKWERSVLFIFGSMIMIVAVCGVLKLCEQQITRIGSRNPESYSIIRRLAAAVLSAICVALVGLFLSLSN
jgi:hypothetical protein